MIITGKKFSKPEMSRVINGDRVLDAEEEKPEKVRLDLLLVNKYKSYNRSSLQKFIEQGYVRVNGEIAKKANQKFDPEAKLELKVPEELKNADIEPEVIWENDDVIVMNKPAGLLSIAKGEYCPEKTMEAYGLLVHRLDRDTSGVMILAKNKQAQDHLHKQFAERKAHKTYYAVVEGRPKLDKAKIDLPIARDLKHKTTFRVDPAGKPAETYYEVLKSNDKYSLVKLQPTTGRTHQLRVHMQYIGHPIVGDPVYGDKKRYDTNVSQNTPVRLFLHAGRLEVELPGGEVKSFEAPRPAEFDELVESE